LLAHIHCFEHNDAVLEASVKGGVPPYHYRWKHNNDTALRQVDLGVGTYEIEVTDSRNERSFDRIYVSQPEPLRVVLSANSVTGWGASDGSVHAVASGGTPPYTFEWGCSTAASVAGLRAGTYHLQLTDANGCSLENSVVVETPDSLTLVAQIYHCTYFGSIQGVQPVEPDDGRMDCKIDGGVKPYIYQWFYQNSNDEWIELLSKNSPYLDSLTGGRYVLFATDANGYSVSDTFEILKPKPLTASVFAISPVCFGNSDGALQTSVDGGIPPYTYRWNLGDSTALLQNLTVGHYAVVVQDLLGVLSTFEILLTQPEPLSIDFSVNEITNNGLNNGAIFTVVQGGIPPYDYVWINHDTIGYSSQIINIPAGIYDFLVTDDNGCLLSTSFALNNPEAMDMSATIQPWR
ncbi:MAG: SprB repeat-containing protein, partial [Bacteroidales bacterium]|nr:SprB repeat-containing protein [Bacteroidales bacterium]